MARFLTPEEARTSLEVQHQRYMADHCCHLCGGSTCTCGRELFWHPDQEDWPAFWARFQKEAAKEPQP